MDERVERDSLGEVRVPADAYWGAQAERARHNFPISGLLPDPLLVRAYLLQKQASARVNAELGGLAPELAGAIDRAAGEMLGGALADQFVVDPFQAGAGTSHHMNVNEVLANRASELLGGARGTYAPVHPNNHVNFGQSTNDTFPTAMRVAILLRQAELDPALEALASVLAGRGEAMAGIVTAGRTHLQDATPITLGQVFHGYADTVRRVRQDLVAAAAGLHEIGLGGTAVGTGINRHPDYPVRVTGELARTTGLALRPTPTPIALHQSTHDFARYAAGMKGVALELIKIANDLRLMASGPTSGIGEIELPAVQPGSSIMPGKVNPVLAENLNMICFHLVGAESTVAYASQAGQFQLNVMMPVIAYEILFAQGILTRGLEVFRERCVAGITAVPERAAAYAARTVALATVLNPVVGYAKAAEIVKQAVREHRSILEVAAEVLELPEDSIRELLDPLRWTEPGWIHPEELPEEDETDPGN